MYPQFEILLISKIERYHDNHTRGKLPSESDFTEFEDSEEVQGSVGATLDKSTGSTPQPSLVMKLNLPNSKDKLRALKVEDDNIDLAASRSAPVVSKKRKVSRQAVSESPSLVGASKRQRHHVTDSSKTMSNINTGIDKSRFVSGAASLRSTSLVDALPMDRRISGNNGPGLRTSEIRHDSLPVQIAS